MPDIPRLSPNNLLSLEIVSLSDNTNVACVAITAFAKQMIPSPSREDLHNITTAVREAVKNAIIHAYPTVALGTIYIKCTIFNHSILRIEISDNGVGIENVIEARKPLFTTGSYAGMGFTIMEAYMTSLDVRSTPDKGTTVTMEYHIRQSK